MGLLDFLKGFDINAGVAAFKQTAQAVLLDVRTSGEFRESPYQTTDRKSVV